MAGSDDLLTPEEIEALMAGARSGSSAPPPPAKSATAPKPAPAPKSTPPDQLLKQAEQHLAEALAAGGPSANLAASSAGASRFEFEDFGRSSSAQPPVEFPIAALQDVELDLRIELGRTELLIEEVLQLREGAVVPLDKLAGDPVDILVNGRLIGRGEVLVLNDNFCVRVAEILAPE